MAAFFDAGQHVREVTFDGRFGEVVRAGVSYSQQHGTFCSFEQRVGPHARLRDSAGSLRISHGSQKQDVDQCVFVSYFKVKYRKWLPKRIVANGEASEPSRHDGDDSEEVTSAASSEDIEVLPDVYHQTASDLQALVTVHSLIRILHGGQPHTPIDDVLDYIREVGLLYARTTTSPETVM